jgi:hypothetical protein
MLHTIDEAPIGDMELLCDEQADTIPCFNENTPPPDMPGGSWFGTE